MPSRSTSYKVFHLISLYILLTLLYVKPCSFKHVR